MSVRSSNGQANAVNIKVKKFWTYKWVVLVVFVQFLNNIQLCFVSGASPLWDDCKRLVEKGTDDARPHSRVLCRVQDTGWVSLLGAGFQWGYTTGLLAYVLFMSVIIIIIIIKLNQISWGLCVAVTRPPDLAAPLLTLHSPSLCGCNHFYQGYGFCWRASTSTAKHRSAIFRKVKF